MEDDIEVGNTELAEATDLDELAVGRLVDVGARWSLINNVVIRLGTLASGIVLARLLTPEDYGVYAVALVVLTVLLSMNEMGVSLAIVRWDKDLHQFAPTVMTLAIGSSATLFLACYMLAPPLADLMNTPDATEVLRLLCFLVLVDGLSTVPSGILTRRFLQGRRFAADVSDFTVSTLVTIVLAIEGYGAMSFAWGRIVGGFLGVLLIWMLAPIRFRPGWDKAEAGSLLRFGLPLAGSSLLIFVLLNVDYAIVGRELSTAQLGFYLMAFNLSSWPVNLFVEAARRVSFAGFSRLAARPEHLGRSFQRGLRVLGALTIPVCAVLIGFAEPLIEVLYGERWLPAAAALEILAVLGLARAIYLLGYDALVAVGRTGALIRLQALWLALLVPALVLGARIGGIRGVSMGHVAVAVLVVLPILLRLLSRYGVSLRRVMKGFGPPIAGGAAILIAAVVVRNEVAHPFAQLAIGGSISGVLYLASTLPFRSMLLSSD